MCLVGFRWRPQGPVPLLLVGNRDEFYRRPAAPLAWWEGDDLLAGRDLQGGGTWLGVNRRGWLATLTNHRDPRAFQADRPSRGELPVRFLQGSHTAAAFLEALGPEATRYNGFNLLLYDGRDLLGFESPTGRIVAFPPGFHAFSNGPLAAPWPKVEALRTGLATASEEDAALLGLLADETPYPDDRLPQTGVPLAWERALSPAFIRTPEYGTRASTVVRVGREWVAVVEQRFSATGPKALTDIRFQPVG